MSSSQASLCQSGLDAAPSFSASPGAGVNWRFALVSCTSCRHAMNSASRGALTFVQCNVFKGLRAGEQSRVCTEYEAKPCLL